MDERLQTRRALKLDLRSALAAAELANGHEIRN